MTLVQCFSLVPETVFTAVWCMHIYGEFEFSRKAERHGTVRGDVVHEVHTSI